MFEENHNLRWVVSVQVEEPVRFERKAVGCLFPRHVPNALSEFHPSALHVNGCRAPDLVSVDHEAGEVVLVTYLVIFELLVAQMIMGCPFVGHDRRTSDNVPLDDLLEDAAGSSFDNEEESLPPLLALAL